MALLRHLQEAGHDAEHIIVLGQRGISDELILRRLNAEELLFLTHDQEFLELPFVRSTSSIAVLRRPGSGEPRLQSGARSALGS